MNYGMLILPFVAGVLMAIQGAINGEVGKIIGVLEGNFLVHIIGSAVIFFLLFVVQIGDGDWAKWREIPLYGYLGGVINVIIIYGVMASIPRLGAATATTAIIVGQVGAAMLIDNLGLFGLERSGISTLQILGLVFLAIGGKLMLGK